MRKPYIAFCEDKAKLFCEIFIEKERVSRLVWFETDKKYAEYLCCERCDAFVVGLLNYCMRYGHAIKSEIPITEDLLYGINEYLVPSLIKYDSRLHKININAPIATECIENAGAIGTGISGGIDSFHEILMHTNSRYRAHNITHLCINNVGSFNSIYKNYGIDKIKNERYAAADEIAQKFGLPIIATDSNFMDAFEQNHFLTHTYSSMFAVFCLQKLWKVYYYASSRKDFSHFSLRHNSTDDSGNYELLSLSCFSTSNLRIFSGGGAYSRFEKTSRIANSNLAKKYLHVCTASGKNCGICPKCRRTLLILDAINKIEDFAETFDIEYFKKHKEEYYEWLCIQHLKNDAMNEPTYKALEARIPEHVKMSANDKFEREKFNSELSKQNSQLRNEIQSLRQQNIQIQKEIQSLKKSFSYRLP